MSKQLVPDGFKVPKGIENDRFRLRMLGMEDIEKDFEAVKSSVDHLKGFFGPNSKWPAEDMTLEQDLADLKWHQEEFEKRSSFAYTVVSPDESRCLGCVYIFPSRKKDYEVDVLLWVRKSELASGLDQLLYETVKNWVKNEWPFVKVAFPGREIDWETWQNLK
jgi:hypothetical protein